uniref:Secreted protein n=1 Tax=Bionectria ochroleuca TaxID=29856 RepID=A0A8H7K8P8_BIOOC
MLMSPLRASAAHLFLLAHESLVACVPALVALRRSLPSLVDVGAGRFAGQVEVSLLEEPPRVVRLGDVDHHGSVHLAICFVAEPMEFADRYVVLLAQDLHRPGQYVALRVQDSGAVGSVDLDRV